MNRRVGIVWALGACTAASLLPCLDGCGRSDEVVLYRSTDAAKGSGGLALDAASRGAGGAFAGGRTGTGGGAGAGGRAGTGGAAGAGGSGGHVGQGGTPASGGTGGAGQGGALANGGSGGASVEAGAFGTCITRSDCPPAWNCAKLDCASPTGLCEPPPLCLDSSAYPVCGCDHITYWNDCLRRQAGVAASTPGECGVGARACTTAVDCGVPNAACSHVVQPPTYPCGPVSPGTCWVTPLDCSTAPGTPPIWALCPLPPLGTPVACVDACTALRSGQEYVLASTYQYICK